MKNITVAAHTVRTPHPAARRNKRQHNILRKHNPSFAHPSPKGNSNLMKYKDIIIPDINPQTATAKTEFQPVNNSL
jgi:hypothetical protein